MQSKITHRINFFISFERKNIPSSFPFSLKVEDCYNSINSVRLYSLKTGVRDLYFTGKLAAL